MGREPGLCPLTSPIPAGILRSLGLQEPWLWLLHLPGSSQCLGAATKQVMLPDSPPDTALGPWGPIEKLVPQEQGPGDSSRPGPQPQGHPGETLASPQAPKAGPALSDSRGLSSPRESKSLEQEKSGENSLE